MTDNASDYALGADVLKLKDIEVVEVATGQTIAAGNALVISGVDGTVPKVSVATAGDKARFIAMQAGTEGAFIRALRRGKVKVTFGGAVAINAPVKAGSSGKIVAAVNTVTVPTGGAGTGDGGALTVEGGIACGYCYQTIAADNDTGLIYFKGD